MKVAIVARGGTNVLAPFRNTEWEIWGLPWISYPRVDRLFEVHSERFYEDSPDSWAKDQDWVERSEIKAPDAKVWCDESRMSVFKNSVLYPVDEVKSSLPKPYLENSICYMLALARYEHLNGNPVEEIGLWGVHMFSGPEAQISQPCVMYHIGLLEGMGIKVTIPDGSPLFMSNYTAGRYGVRGGKGSMRPKIISYAGVTPYE